MELTYVLLAFVVIMSANHTATNREMLTVDPEVIHNDFIKKTLEKILKKQRKDENGEGGLNPVKNRIPNESENIRRNEKPIIGILTQPKDDIENFNSYFMAAYVKWVQQGGARVVPVFYSNTDEQLLEIMEQINGLIIPGGNVKLIETDGKLTDYSKKSKLLVDKAKEMNDKGIVFPIWGVGMGLQQIGVLEAPFGDTLTTDMIQAYDYPSTIKFVGDPRETRLYKECPNHLLTALEKEEISYHAHRDGLMPEIFIKYPALMEYRVVSTGFDRAGVEYVSTIEHKKYPFYAFQSHPEKSAYVWITFRNIPHSKNAVEIGQYYALFFVDEGCKNMNKFRDPEEEGSLMVENFTVKSTDGVLQDLYVFGE